MNKYLFPSENRLCVHFPTLIPSIPRHKIVEYLSQKGFLITKVNIIHLAESQLGKPYRRGSHSKHAQSFDCSSLTQWLYGQIGIYIPRISIDQRAFGQPVTVENLRAGDLVFTTGHINYYWDNDESNGVGHVGIFTGQSVIHAANPKRGVVEDSFDSFVKGSIRGMTRIYEHLLDADTLIMPKKNRVEYDLHLRWRVLQTLS